ncbi:hypothetical protein T4E_3980 [Trichinella pseudospiralis]|uniref:Uncharacterized protein n=1 Tax=Trichinella pseudospiralis TaxID=6337 RepID=A0A0V0YMR6_TRIPS|nr:hypothetical protein T4E_3980 [Trichinella pseudospiralis]
MPAAKTVCSYATPLQLFPIRRPWGPVSINIFGIPMSCHDKMGQPAGITGLIHKVAGSPTDERSDDGDGSKKANSSL